MFELGLDCLVTRTDRAGPALHQAGNHLVGGPSLGLALASLGTGFGGLSAVPLETRLGAWNSIDLKAGSILVTVDFLVSLSRANNPLLLFL